MKNKKTELHGAKYSEMLMQIVDAFDEELPENLSFEDTLEIGIDAWNLANNKDILGDDLYKKELKGHQYKTVIEQMVNFKLERFSTHKNYIVAFSTENGLLRVKSQSFEEKFDHFLSKMLIPNQSKE